MTETVELANRIYALSRKLNREPTTLSRKLLGNGVRLAELAAGSTMTMDVYARVERVVADLEAEQV